MSDFRVPVRGGIWSLRTDADLGGGEGLALWLPEAGSGTPGSWGRAPGGMVLRARGLPVLAFRRVSGSPESD